MDQDAEGDPEQQRKGHHRSHDVISQKLPECVDIQFVDEVPKTLHDILHLLHALPLQRGTHLSGKASPSHPCVEQCVEETHRSVTIAHCAGFAFAQEQEVACFVLVGGAGAAAAAAADFT